MKKLFVLCCLCIIAGCSSGGKASDTYTSFATSLEKGDLDSAYALIDKASRALLDQRGGKANLAASADLIKKHQGIKEIKVVSEEAKGDNSTSQASITFNDGFSGQVTNNFAREDGKWKLVVK